MRHRIHVPNVGAPGEQIEVGGEEFHHAARVVRLREAEQVELFDGKGHAVSGVVAALGRETVTIRVLSAIDLREAATPIDLAMSIIQLEKFELVLQKATELGVRAIVPLVTDRCEVRPERYRGKHQRWEKIVFEAVKQSGRSVIPQLAEPLSLDDALARDGERVVFDADIEPSAKADSTVPGTTLFIGPEGGWSERELVLARTTGCSFRRLGARRLRAETAAIVALATEAGRRGELD